MINFRDRSVVHLFHAGKQTEMSYVVLSRNPFHVQLNERQTKCADCGVALWALKSGEVHCLECAMEKKSGQIAEIKRCASNDLLMACMRVLENEKSQVRVPSWREIFAREDFTRGFEGNQMLIHFAPRIKTSRLSRLCLSVGLHLSTNA